MRKSPGRVARPICLIMALALFVATMLLLAVGATQHGEQATISLQMAAPLALLAVMWILVGIMFTLATPDHRSRRAERAQQSSTPPEEPKVNWFQDATTGESKTRQGRSRSANSRSMAL